MIMFFGKRADPPCSDCWDEQCTMNCSPAADPMFGCDCCGEMVPQGRIRVVIAYGIETSACAACRGDAE